MFLIIRSNSQIKLLKGRIFMLRLLIIFIWVNFKKREMMLQILKILTRQDNQGKLNKNSRFLKKMPRQEVKNEFFNLNFKLFLFNSYSYNFIYTFIYLEKMR